ncbi:hypothetical protein KEC56_12625 [Microbacterium sp. YMB-B2]|uniref:Uncharacterized protein n=1 Tax=Microbacterium tenebrionis TaxID=2830665 RepID=A0A9X1LR50_9MICO|nr:hypothetical protein [Microbacterium tenebrionis]MCC2030346.1 hypothetical protein [Microbacterium tenebrionis]
MGRKSTVQHHPQRARIESMLDDGVSYADIVRSVGGTSIASVGRFALSRKTELAKIADGLPTITDLSARLIEAADDAQDLRRHSRLAGTPVARARAIRAEVDVLTKLIQDLEVTDASYGELAEQVKSLIHALSEFARHEPEHARPLIDRLRADLPDVAAALDRRTGTKS